MKVRSKILKYIHLDKTYSLLTGRNVKLLLEIFKMLDIHDKMELNDIQFFYFMRHVTDLDSQRIYRVFDMLDVDGSGEIDFDEFYLLMCILIAVKDNEEKQFIYRHSRTVFDLLDENCSQTISAREFESFGFLFNLHGTAVKKIFNEFDMSGDKELDYKEFRMFAMACIDKQQELDTKSKLKEEEKHRKAYLKSHQKRERVPAIKRRWTTSRRQTHQVAPSTDNPGYSLNPSTSDPKALNLSVPRGRMSEFGTAGRSVSIRGSAEQNPESGVDQPQSNRFCAIL